MRWFEQLLKDLRSKPLRRFLPAFIGGLAGTLVFHMGQEALFHWLNDLLVHWLGLLGLQPPTISEAFFCIWQFAFLAIAALALFMAAREASLSPRTIAYIGLAIFGTYEHESIQARQVALLQKAAAGEIAQLKEDGAATNAQLRSVQQETAALRRLLWQESGLTELQTLAMHYKSSTERYLDGFCSSPGKSRDARLAALESEIAGGETVLKMTAKRYFGMELNLGKHPIYDGDPNYKVSDVGKLLALLDKREQQRYRLMRDQFQTSNRTIALVIEQIAADLARQKKSLIVVAAAD